MLFTELCSFANRAIFRVVTEILTCNANGAIGTSERSQEPTFPKMVTKLKYSIWGEVKEQRKDFSTPTWQKVVATESSTSPRSCWALLESRSHGWAEKRESSQNQQPQYENMKKMYTWPCAALLKIDVITGGITELTRALTKVYKGFISYTLPVFSASDRWYPQTCRTIPWIWHLSWYWAQLKSMYTVYFFPSPLT